MIEWLQKIAGVASSGQNAEREEYKQLKKEVKAHKKKVVLYFYDYSILKKTKKML
jgi:hypothetical protein